MSTRERIKAQELRRRRAGILRAFRAGLDAEPMTRQDRLRTLAQLRRAGARKVQSEMDL